MAWPLAALLAAAALAAVPAKSRNATAGGQRPAKPAAASSPTRSHAAKPREATSALTRARAQLAAVKRDPAKRRYRHHWERAIRSLERAATGKDRAVALHEAARARYALYRLSAIEADRDESLRLAGRAAKAGSREAATFAAAVRREAGDEEPATARGTRLARPAQRRPDQPAPAAERAASTDEEASDPELEKVVTEVLEPQEVPLAPVGPESSPAPAEPARVSEVKSWSSADYTRVAIYLSHDVPYQKQELAAEGDRPRRLALDLKPAQLEGKGLAHAVGGARVEQVRAAQHSPDTVRVVLDLPGKDSYQLFSLDDPPRLIVDVGTREAQREARAAALPPPPPGVEAEELAAGADRRPIRRVVVDAGHGGHDTGAIGPRRVREKDVTLAMARRLARKLEAAGFEVVLTRRDDRYLALEERTALANTARGDLFLSIHANAHPRRDRNGVETYFLNVTDDRYAARLAARENGALSLDGEAPPLQVKRILTDLNAKASAGASRRLAQIVQKEVCTGVRAQFGDVRDLGVKNALFYVLLGARMPAVLVETAFISNRAEEQRLSGARYQEVVAESVARAVVSFAGKQPPRVAAAR